MTYEMLHDLPYSNKCDVYACAVLIDELFRLDNLLQKIEQVDGIDHAKKRISNFKIHIHSYKQYEIFTDARHKDIAQLLREMINFEEKLIPTMEEVLNRLNIAFKNMSYNFENI